MDAETKAVVERIEAEDNRQNHRLDKIEAEVASFHSIAISVERLATNMENMLKEQARQGERLELLEAKPAETINDIKKSTINTIIGVVVGALTAGAIALIVRYI